MVRSSRLEARTKTRMATCVGVAGRERERRVRRATLGFRVRLGVRLVRRDRQGLTERRGQPGVLAAQDRRARLARMGRLVRRVLLEQTERMVLKAR